MCIASCSDHWGCAACSSGSLIQTRRRWRWRWILSSSSAPRRARQSRKYAAMASGVPKRTEQASTTDASPAAQRAGTRLPARYLLAGFLSGASGLVALLLLLALLLMIGALWPLLFDIASGMRGKLPFWQTVGQAVAQS